VPAARWAPTLEDYVDIATHLLSATSEAVRRLPRLALAESAIHAPFASFAGTEPYHGLIEQAAILIERLVQNHPLPDGNKRAAFLLTARFLDANGRTWGRADPDTDATMVERIASSEASHDEVVAWITTRTSST